MHRSRDTRTQGSAPIPAERVALRAYHVVSRRVATAARLCVVAALGVSTLSIAQETTRAPSSAQPPAPTPAPEDAAIATAEVSRRAEQTASILSQSAAASASTDRIERLAQRVPKTEKMLRKRLAILERSLATSGNRARLADASTEWSHSLSELQGWRDEVAPITERVGSAIATLSEERDLWARTRASAEQTGAPDAIARRIEETLDAIDRELENARNRQESVLTLQDEIIQLELLVTSALDSIRTAQNASRRSLFRRDAPALWSDLLGADPEAHLDDVRDSIRDDFERVVDFIAASGSKFLLDLLIFLVVAHYAFAVKRRLEDPVDGLPPLGRSAELFRRPISIALLATILMMRFIHGPAPMGFTTLVSIALLVPLVRLVPFLLPAPMRWVVWVLAGLIVLSRVRRMFHEAPLLGELLIALEIGGMIASLIWLMRPSRLREIPADAHLPRLLVVGMRLTLALLGLSLLSSSLGFRDFGMLIGDATLVSVYVAVVLYAAARATEAAMDASFHTAPARKLSFVRRRRDAVLRVTGRYASAAAFLYWGFLTLQVFEMMEPASALVDSILGAEINVGEIEISVGDLLAFAFTIAVAFVFSRLIRFFLEEEAFTRMKLRRGVGNAVATLLQYAILMLGFALALSAAGMDFSRVALFAGAFSVGIGFGLQTVVNNFVSGLILLFERPIQIGDMVEIGGTLGEVRRIGARSSTIRTFDGAEIIVPNANLITEPVVNWTLSDRRRRLEIEVGVAYGTDPQTVLDLLRDVAGTEEVVLPDPAPEALFAGFGDSALNFRLRVWVPRFEESLTVKSRLTVAVSKALREAGIEIPFPQRDLHVRSVDPKLSGLLKGPKPKPK